MKKINYFFVAALATVIVALSYNFDLFSGMENFFEDRLFSSKPISGQLLIVSIDDESISQIGQWPWSRKVLADALLKMEKFKPAVVGLDVVLAEQSRFGIDDDNSLAQALDKISYPVVMSVEAKHVAIRKEKITANNFIEPLKIFSDNKNVRLGHVNIITDSDGVIRKFPKIIEQENNQETFFPNLAYQMIESAGIKINQNDQGVERIMYSFKPGAIRNIPFWRILKDEEILEQIKGKIIFIGATAADLHDMSVTPISRGKEMAGVEIQANIANMLISDYRLESISKLLMFFWFLIIALVSASLFVFLKGEIKPVALNFVFLLIYLAVAIILFENGLTANVVHLILAWFFSTITLFGWRYFITDKEKRELRKVFSKYVSKEVVEEILKNPNEIKLGGEEKVVTVLFSDIRGFTTISEKISPAKLVEILNKYFTTMTGEIIKNKGVLDKYIGDAIMAFWGAPLIDENQADNALLVALDMLEKLKKLNKEFALNNWPEIKIGIGIYSGLAVAGNIGSDLRMNYTVVGDTVNIASRLESLTKDYNVSLIVGESVKDMVKVKDKFVFQFLGSTTVKGKTKAVKIYTVDKLNF